jgi:hypothetical protein
MTNQLHLKLENVTRLNHFYLFVNKLYRNLDYENEKRW